MWVIKIGGSLAGATALPRWLSLLRQDRTRRWLMVPGGGPYADIVRAMQARWGFDDANAHRMAVQAMGLFGAQLAALDPGLEAGTQLDELGQGPGASVWCPGPDAPDLLRGLPENWQLSADSIALWAAQRRAAQALVLLKSAPPPNEEHRAGALSAAGYIDACFPALLAARPLPCYWLSAASAPGAIPDAVALAAQRIEPD